MKIGFTGTRDGMTKAQRATFGLFMAVDVTDQYPEFRHGSCKGADVEAAQVVRHVRAEAKIIAHPGPDNDPCREVSGVADDTLPGKTHFARNRDIVDQTDRLVACPKQMEPQSFGGTWYTIGYARKKGKPVTIIWPDGTVQHDPETGKGGGRD